MTSTFLGKFYNGPKPRRESIEIQEWEKGQGAGHNNIGYTHAECRVQITKLFSNMRLNG